MRLPFLNQAIQGDDVYFLYGAEQAQIDPLHPDHAQFVFMGDHVDMRGNTHPPLVQWILGGLLAIFRDIREVPFHAAYIVFSLIAAAAALALARRFTEQPLLATMLFLVTPVFVVNGNSLETDVPFVAFWLAAIAMFVRAVDNRSMPWLVASCFPMALAVLDSYQAVVLIPILLLYGWRWRPAWFVALTPAIVIGGFQIYGRLSTGAAPAAVLTGYMKTYGWQAFGQKIRNAIALTGHMGWLVFPGLAIAAFWRRWIILIPLTLAAAIFDPNPMFWLSISAGLAVLICCAERWRDFSAQWVLVFFAASLVIFFAGSARYLLPIALPVAILAARQLAPKWLYAGLAVQATISLMLAVVNYQHWDGYRQFAAQFDTGNKRLWINSEWGLRYYLESKGGVPIVRDQVLHPGDVIVSSALAYPVPYTAGGGVLAPTSSREITSRIPLRLVGLNSKAAYSTTEHGLRPFDISTGPIDRIRVETVTERVPALEYLTMNAKEAGEQIVDGISDLEDNRWRWMSGRGVLILKSPAQAVPVKVDLNIPDQAPCRAIKIYIDDQLVKSESFDKPGSYTVTTAPTKPSGATATLRIEADKTFTVPSDNRELGIILTGAGFSQ